MNTQISTHNSSRLAIVLSFCVLAGASLYMTQLQSAQMIFDPEIIVDDVVECIDDSDCGFAEACFEGSCLNMFPEQVILDECVSNSDCGFAHECFEGSCLNMFPEQVILDECVSNSDCGFAHECFEGSCLNMFPVPFEGQPGSVSPFPEEPGSVSPFPEEPSTGFFDWFPFSW
jgi:hypothetical protein